MATASDGIRLGDKSGLAAADWVSITRGNTSGTRTTGAGGTRIRLLNTLLVLANEPIATVRISIALWERKNIFLGYLEPKEIPFNHQENILPGPQPVIVSGFGTSPGRQLQTGFPSRLSTQVVPGPQGEGLHGSGRGTQAFWMQTWP